MHHEGITHAHRGAMYSHGKRRERSQRKQSLNHSRSMKQRRTKQGGKGVSGATRPGEMAAEGHLFCLEEAPPMAMELVNQCHFGNPCHQNAGPRSNAASLDEAWNAYANKVCSSIQPELSPHVASDGWHGTRPSERATRKGGKMVPQSAWQPWHLAKRECLL